MGFPVFKRSFLLSLILFAVACGDDSKQRAPYIIMPEADAGSDTETDAEPDVVCEAESDIVFCERLERECGGLTAADNCGVERTVLSCGDEATVCGEFQTCGGGGQEGVCGCAPQTDAELCSASNIECGPLNVQDRCGQARDVNCGDSATVCGEFETCGGGGEDGQCGCIVESDTEMCDRIGFDCGSLEDIDNCGTIRLIESCGDEATVCGDLQTCGGDGIPGLCGCPAESDEDLCARNSQDCGELVAIDNCNTSRTVASCGTADPIADELLCASSGIVCGPLTTTDNCGLTRNIDSCGLEANVCGDFQTCGGGGVVGVCGCTPMNDTQLCQANTYACGTLTATDNCGVVRTVNSCGPECAAPTSCGGAGVTGQCGCTPNSDAELCATRGADCGSVSITDNCNVIRPIECGIEADVCLFFDTCGGGGTANACGCTPTSCAAEGILCGDFADGCGENISCNSFCVQELQVGAIHACAIGTGRLKCWGGNDKGQLGDGTTTQRNNPVNITVPPVVKVAPGRGHTCVVTVTGAVHCWGDNSSGQLGLGTTVDNPSPGQAAIGTGATQVVAGENHACALVNGGVRCWGSNTFGKIGNSLLNYGANVAVPNAVDNLTSGVADITSGQHHMCALKNDGTVWCWGRNQFGQVGNLEITVGLAILAWAFNNALSLDVNTQVNSPIQVMDLPPAVAIAAGADYSCAIDENGAVWCWGAMTRPPGQNPCPVGVGTDTNGLDIVVNGQACALFPTTGGVPITQYTFNTNTDQNTINTVFSSRAAINPVMVAFAFPATELGAGNNHLCAITEDPNLLVSNIKCLGFNASGQLGDGTNNNWIVPQSVFLDDNNEVVRGQTVTGGESFTCTLVEDANVKCWGSNQNGQIGNSSLNRSETYRPYDVRLDFQP